MIKVVNKYFFKGEGEYIGRGSVLGNKWSHKRGTKADYATGTVQEVVDAYAVWLDEKIKSKDKVVCDEMNRLYKLAKQGDLNLICYCKRKGDELCHGDVIKDRLEKVLYNP